MGVGGLRYAPATLPPGKRSVNSFYRRLGGPQYLSGLLREMSPPAEIRSSDRPARTKSLYQLSYSGPLHLRSGYSPDKCVLPAFDITVEALESYSSFYRHNMRPL